MSAVSPSRLQFRPPLWAWLGLLPCLALLIALGTWQLDRGLRKIALQQTLDEAQQRAPTALSRSIPILFEAEASHLDGLTTARPAIHFKHEGEAKTLECDFIAGCDGFHGICRPAIPEHLMTVYDRIFPFGWLGILAESKPFPEMSYSNHERGFSLASRRSPTLSRLYVQCAIDEDLNGWSDRRIWDELQLRLYAGSGELAEGPILQKGVTPCRAYVAAPMNYGRLYLAGDAVHIADEELLGADLGLTALTDDPAITGAVDFLPAPFTLKDARQLIDAYGFLRLLEHRLQLHRFRRTHTLPAEDDDAAAAAATGAHLCTFQSLLMRMPMTKTTKSPSILAVYRPGWTFIAASRRNR